MGLGNFAAGQIIKGLIFLAIEVGMICLLTIPIIPDIAKVPHSGIDWIKMLPSLGDREDGKEVVGNIEVTVFGDRSQMILLYSVIFFAIIVAFIVIWQASVRSGYQALRTKKSGKKAPTFVQDVKSLFDENIHKLMMIVPFILLMVFTVVPLVYMICMAFTNYDSKHQNLFDWVGFDTFALLFESGGSISKQFWSVLGWTIVWAFFATFLNFFLGTFMAMIINRPTTRIKGFWRTMLSFTIAIPQFVSLLIIGQMFALNGIINRMLMDLHWIAEPIKFTDNATNARIFVIVINLWVGIPYTVMQVTGILKNIPADLYEAAKIDGANVVQQFMNITLPYMIFVLTPYIITSFTGNINNFNVIFLLTGGGPFGLEGTAGKTDLLVTWLYRLSVEKFEYNLAAVIGIFTFIILAIISLVTYRSSGSYKDEEGFK
ncbi:MAG: sugar ABC transporter permease [Oscillospiraceae bacterium]|nr:sugar ABC transporter permease [Oscillospiraceae bacterium]